MSQRRKAKSLTVKGDEATAYEQLRKWVGRDDAARFVLLVLGSRPVVVSEPDPPKWFVPSSSRTGEFHVVDIELRVCDCSGASALMIPKQTCGAPSSGLSEL
ncbi:MAG TPA: hypothetical protein VJ464_17940 [Blastocatellia bacterium]|nr:hypothetical protein [Blastocatellia bacterium]